MPGVSVTVTSAIALVGTAVIAVGNNVFTYHFRIGRCQFAATALIAFIATAYLRHSSLYAHAIGSQSEA